MQFINSIQKGYYKGVFIDSSQLKGPTNVWFNKDGYLMVTDYKGSSVKRFDSSGHFIDNYHIGLGQSEGIVILANGNVLIGNGRSHSVKLFNSDGTYIKEFIPPKALNLLNPNAIIIRYK